MSFEMDEDELLRSRPNEDYHFTVTEEEENALLEGDILELTADYDDEFQDENGEELIVNQSYGNNSKHEQPISVDFSEENYISNRDTVEDYKEELDYEEEEVSHYHRDRFATERDAKDKSSSKAPEQSVHGYRTNIPDSLDDNQTDLQKQEDNGNTSNRNAQLKPFTSRRPVDTSPSKSLQSTSSSRGGNWSSSSYRGGGGSSWGGRGGSWGQQSNGGGGNWRQQLRLPLFPNPALSSSPFPPSPESFQFAMMAAGGMRGHPLVHLNPRFGGGRGGVQHPAWGQRMAGPQGFYHPNQQVGLLDPPTHQVWSPQHGQHNNRTGWPSNENNTQLSRHSDTKTGGDQAGEGWKQRPWASTSSVGNSEDSSTHQAGGWKPRPWASRSGDNAASSKSSGWKRPWTSSSNQQLASPSWRQQQQKPEQKSQTRPVEKQTKPVPSQPRPVPKPSSYPSQKELPTKPSTTAALPKPTNPLDIRAKREAFLDSQSELKRKADAELKLSSEQAEKKIKPSGSEPPSEEEKKRALELGVDVDYLRTYERSQVDLQERRSAIERGKEAKRRQTLAASKKKVQPPLVPSAAVRPAPPKAPRPPAPIRNTNPPQNQQPRHAPPPPFTRPPFRNPGQPSPGPRAAYQPSPGHSTSYQQPPIRHQQQHQQMPMQHRPQQQHLQQTSPQCRQSAPHVVPSPIQHPSPVQRGDVRKRVVFVSQLPPATGEDDLKSVLVIFGMGEVIQWTKDKRNALIKFETPTHAADFITRCSGIKIRGIPLRAAYPS